MTEVKYVVMYYDHTEDWTDVSDDFTSEAEAVNHAKKNIPLGGSCVVEKITTEGVVDVSQSKKIVVTKIK